MGSETVSVWQTISTSHHQKSQRKQPWWRHFSKEKINSGLREVPHNYGQFYVVALTH